MKVKILMLIDSDERRCSLTRFLLNTRGYRTVTYADALLAEAYHGHVDGVIAYMPTSVHAVDRIAAMRGIDAVLVVPSIHDVQALYATTVQEQGFTAADLATHARILTNNRKRGRKSLWRAAVYASILEAQA